MPIWNIIDGRKRRYRFLTVNAVVEAAWHDNSCKDSDTVRPARGGPDYEEREGITVADAVVWAQKFDSPVTLFLYDEGEGIRARSPIGRGPGFKSQAGVGSTPTARTNAISRRVGDSSLSRCERITVPAF